MNQHLNQHKPIAERHPALLRLLENPQSEVQLPESSVRRLANKEFIRSLSLLEHTLSGEEEIIAIEPTIELTIEPVLTELDELADAVADIEAYIRDHEVP